jgi:hypothetical protein
MISSIILRVIFDGIANVFKGVINIIIDGLNFFIRQLNKIKIEVPEGVPGFGGTKFGFSVPEIPKLANGGIVNGATTFMAGEAGAEAIVPLENSAFIDMFASKLASMMNNNNSSSQEPAFYLDSVKFARAIMPALTNENNRRGNTTIIQTQ